MHIAFADNRHTGIARSFSCIFAFMRFYNFEEKRAQTCQEVEQSVLQHGERQLVCVTDVKFPPTLDDQLGYQKKRKILERVESERNGLPDVQCRIAPKEEEVSHDEA